MFKKIGRGITITVLILIGIFYSIYQIVLNYPVDLTGGRELVYKLDLEGIELERNQDMTKATEAVKQVIKRRLGAFGLRGSQISIRGEDQIVVQVPPVSDFTNIKQLIQMRGVFELVLEAPSSGGVGSRLSALRKEVELFNKQELHWESLRESSPASELIPKAQKGPTWQLLDKEIQIYNEQMATYTNRRSLLPPDEAAKLKRPTPPEWNVLPSQELIHEMGSLKSVNRLGSYIIIHYEDKYRVSGNQISDAYHAKDGMYDPAIGFKLNSQGAKQLGELTQKNIGRTLVVTLDDKVIQVARIMTKISKEGVIESGMNKFHPDYVMRVVGLLKGGGLPTNLILISESVIGPALDQ